MSYQSEVLADSPLLYYRQKPASGTVVTDSSGNGRNATMSASGVTDVAGPVDRAFQFDGSTGQLYIGWVAAGLSTAADAPFTVEFWAKTTATAVNYADPAFASGSESAAAKRFVVGLGNTTGHLQVQQRSNYLRTTGTTVINDGTWRHFAVHLQDPTGPAHIFIDGVEEAYTEAQFTLGEVGAGTPTVRFGRNGRGTFLNGTMAEIALYDGLLSQTRIAAHYAAASLPTVLRRGWGITLN